MVEAVHTTAKQEAEREALAACSSMPSLPRQTDTPETMRQDKLLPYIVSLGYFDQSSTEVTSVLYTNTSYITLFLLHVICEHREAVIYQCKVRNLKLQDGETLNVEFQVSCLWT